MIILNTSTSINLHLSTIYAAVVQLLKELKVMPMCAYI